MLGRILCKAVVGVLFISVSAFARIGGLTDVDTGMEVWDADQRYLRPGFEGDVNITGTVSVVGDVRVNGASVTNTMGNALLRTGGEMSGVLVAGRVHYLPVGTDIGAYIASTNVVAGDVVKLGAGEWAMGATQLVIGKAITLSGQGAGSTVLSWNGPVGSFAGAVLVSAAGVVLEGLTLNWDGILAYNETVVRVDAGVSARIDRVTILGESGSGSIRGITAYGPSGKVELNDSIVDVNMGAQVGSERGSGLLLLSTSTGVVRRSSIRIGTASLMQACGVEGQGSGSLSLADSRVVASGAGSSYGVFLFTSCTIDGGYVSGGTYDLLTFGTGPYVYPVLSPLTLGNGSVSTNIVLDYTVPSGSDGQLIAGAARFAGNVVATNGTIKARFIEGGAQTTPSGTVGLTMTAGVDADNFTAAGLVPVHATESVGLVATGEYGGVAKGSLISIYPDDRVDWDGLSMTNMFNVGATGIVVGGIDVRAGDGTSLTNLAGIVGSTSTGALQRTGGATQVMYGDLHSGTNMFYGQRFGINAGTNAYMTGGIAPLGLAHAFGGSAGANATGNYWHAFGLEAGRSATGNYWTAVGYRAGRYASGANWNALGQQAGEAASGTAWYAIGTGAGQYSSGDNWLAIGSEAGAGSTGNTWCAIGGYAVGKGAQGTDWSAIGRAAGFETVGDSWSAIGGYAGMRGLHTNSTSIGTYAGYMARGKNRLYIDVYTNNPSYAADGATNDTIFIDSNAHLYLGGGAGRAQYPSAGGTLRGAWEATTLSVTNLYTRGLVKGSIVDRSYDITMPAWLSTTNTYTTAPAVSKLLVRANGTTAPFTKTVEVDWFAGDGVADQNRLGRSVFGLETVAMSALASAGQNVVQVNQVGQLFDGDLLHITATDGLVNEYARASVVMDTQAWQISYKGEQAVINCLAVYDGKLYAGQGNAQGAGDVLVFDGDRWRVSYDGSENSILSLAVHNGKLYAGQGTGTGDGDVFEFDGVSWVRIYNGTSSQISALTSYTGNLFAGEGTASGSATAILMVWNGISWAVSYVFAEAYVNALAVHGGFLYVGRGGSTAGSGKIDYWNGAAWIPSFNGAGVYEVIGGMGIFDNTVFAGLGSSAGDGVVVYLSGGSWLTAWSGAGSQINALTPYDGKLYLGQGNLAASAAVYSYLSGVTTLRYSDSARSRIGALAEYDGVLYAGTSLTGDVLRHTPTGQVILDRPLVNSYSFGALVHRVYEGNGWTGSTNTTLRIKTVSDVGGYGVKVIFKEVE